MLDAVIYYFSGTGNSLHVARELQRRMPEFELVPMLSLLNGESVTGAQKAAGFVFPVHVNAIPRPVQMFLQKMLFHPSAYKFAVTTHCGFPGKIDYQLQMLLQERGPGLDAYFSLKMMMNTPTGLMPVFMVRQRWAEQIGRDKITSLEMEVQRRLDLIAATITNKEVNVNKGQRLNIFSRLVQAYLLRISRRDAVIDFHTDSDCGGCGTCEQVCLGEKIVLSNGKPAWQKHKQCHYCYACFNFCPKQAILVKHYQHKDGRYSHPDITARDIAAQKG